MSIEERNERFDMLARISGMPIVTSGTCTLMQFLPGQGTQKAYDDALQYVARCPDCYCGVHTADPRVDSKATTKCLACKGTGWAREHHFLTFIAEVGRGKTHLALGIGWHWIGQDMGVVKFWQVSELLDAMRREFDKMPEDDYGNPRPGEFEKAKGCSLLILDDLGIQKSTPWVDDKLDTLIDHRWLEGKPTVFTTKLAPGKLGPHIRSRLQEGVTVTLEGPDYREVKAKLRKEGTSAKN